MARFSVRQSALWYAYPTRVAISQLFRLLESELSFPLVLFQNWRSPEPLRGNRCRIFGSNHQCAVFPGAHDPAGRQPNVDRFVQSERGRARIKSDENHSLAQSGYQSKILGAAALNKHNDYRSVLMLWQNMAVEWQQITKGFGVLHWRQWLHQSGWCRLRICLRFDFHEILIRSCSCSLTF